MEQWLMENSFLVLCLFIGVAVLAIVISIVFSAKKRGEKKKRLQENENMSELVFDAMVTLPKPITGPLGRSEGYTLYAVNGEEPKIYNRSVLVSEGEVSLDFEYCFQTVGNRFATSFGRSIYTFSVSPGTKYIMQFNYLEKKLEHKEK